jgi:alanyl-tRNA synthetase
MGATTLSFHLGERYSSIDIDVPPFDRDDAYAVEDEVLRVIGDDYRVITHLCPPGDASRFPLRKEPSVEEGVLRVVEIDGIEYSACCGTHVASTRAIGSFRITRVEKYKAGCRVQYVAGGRAFGDYRRLAAIVRDTAATAGVPEDDLPGSVAAYRDRIKLAERALETARDAVASSSAAALDASSPAGAIVFADAADFDSASRLGRALAKRGRVVVVACRADLKAVICAPAPVAPGASPVDEVFGPLVARHGGKGGGGKAFFQAAFTDESSLDLFVAAARFA